MVAGLVSLRITHTYFHGSVLPAEASLLSQSKRARLVLCDDNLSRPQHMVIETVAFAGDVRYPASVHLACGVMAKHLVPGRIDFGARLRNDFPNPGAIQQGQEAAVQALP